MQKDKLGLQIALTLTPDKHITFVVSCILITIPKMIDKKQSQWFQGKERKMKYPHIVIYTFVLFGHNVYILPIQKALNELTKEIHKTQNVFPTIFIKIIMEVSFSINS